MVSMQIATKEAKDVSEHSDITVAIDARAMETADRERLQKANYDILQNSKEARVKKRHKKCILENTLAEERKNPSYEAAMH
ncbi:uncharacterized protein TNCV_3711421 [Trichonephila clavipes]|uniref:Uncharacterized protein n=1 Tax=Trichonephila clavipes TaxID=2585209 RepID=A0A8X6R8Y6_TRICX|nr:uncharacterized protein TNCV_3711421 [Trichonephila clavipes]